MSLIRGNWHTWVRNFFEWQPRKLYKWNLSLLIFLAKRCKGNTYPSIFSCMNQIKKFCYDFLFFLSTFLHFILRKKNLITSTVEEDKCHLSIYLSIHLLGPVDEGKCPSAGSTGNINDFCATALKISGLTPIHQEIGLHIPNTLGK